MRYAKLLSVLFRTSVQTEMEYRADFYTRIVASLLGLLTTLGSLSIVYGYTNNIKGWSFPQVLVLLAVYYLMHGLIEMFIAPNMRNVMGQVRDGTLDFVLLKPVPAQFLASFRTLDIWQAPLVLVGLGLSFYTIGKLSLSVGAVQAVAFAASLLAGSAVVYSFWLVLVTLTFWFVKIDNIEQVMWQAFEAGRMPIEIYPAWLRGTLTYIIPITFIITVPAQELTGRINPAYTAISLVVGILSVLLSSAFWRFGLKHYTGASA